MRAVIQRVKRASVTVESRIIGNIDEGVVILLGIHESDSMDEVLWLANKVTQLRIFEDEQGKMNYSLLEIKGEALIISQFTLYGECEKGRRPSFVKAARPEKAIPLYKSFIENVKSLGVGVQTGEFGADMLVSLENNGPVTLIVDTPEKRQPC